MILFLLGDVSGAVGILILYVVITVIRNILEPRIVGRQIGLHPLATLIAMFAGVKLFGLIGLIGFPLLLSVFVNMKREEQKS